MDEQEKQEEQQPVSRIVIEFAGPGQADVKRAIFENVSLGQMLAFARYAEWRCVRAIAQFEKAREASAVARPSLVVPKGIVQ